MSFFKTRALSSVESQKTLRNLVRARLQHNLITPKHFLDSLFIRAYPHQCQLDPSNVILLRFFTCESKKEDSKIVLVKLKRCKTVLNRTKVRNFQMRKECISTPGRDNSWFERWEKGKKDSIIKNVNETEIQKYNSK